MREEAIASKVITFPRTTAPALLRHYHLASAGDAAERLAASAQVTS